VIVIIDDPPFYHYPIMITTNSANDYVIPMNQVVNSGVVPRYRQGRSGGSVRPPGRGRRGPRRGGSVGSSNSGGRVPRQPRMPRSNTQPRNGNNVGQFNSVPAATACDLAPCASEETDATESADVVIEMPCLYCGAVGNHTCDRDGFELGRIVEKAGYGWCTHVSVWLVCIMFFIITPFAAILPVIWAIVVARSRRFTRRVRARRAFDDLSDQFILNMYDVDKVEKPGYRRVPRFVHHFAVTAKARFGVQDPTKVNKMAVRDYLYRKMKETTLRNADIARYIDLAVTMSFIRSDEEITAMYGYEGEVFLDRLQENSHAST